MSIETKDKPTQVIKELFCLDGEEFDEGALMGIA